MTITNQNTPLPYEDGSMESIENALFGEEVGSQMKFTRGLWGHVDHILKDLHSWYIIPGPSAQMIK